MCILQGYINIYFILVFVLKCLVDLVCIIFFVPRSSVLRKVFEVVKL